MKSTVGSSAAPTARKLPMATPSGTAIAAAMAKAVHTRAVETPACHKRPSEAIIRPRLATTTVGAGRNAGVTRPERAKASQARSSASAVPPPSSAPERGRHAAAATRQPRPPLSAGRRRRGR